jgi:hypothetical protein
MLDKWIAKRMGLPSKTLSRQSWGFSLRVARYKPSVGFFLQIEVIGFDVVSFFRGS